MPMSCGFSKNVSSDAEVGGHNMSLEGWAWSVIGQQSCSVSEEHRPEPSSLFSFLNQREMSNASFGYIRY